MMNKLQLDISYTDSATTELNRPFDDLKITDRTFYPDVRDAADFCFRVQPAPHSPLFRRSFLQRAVETAPFPPLPQYNSVAEIWFYFICAHLPARVEKVDGHFAIGGLHENARITSHWEILALGSLAIMEDFLTAMSPLPERERLKSLLA